MANFWLCNVCLSFVYVASASVDSNGRLYVESANSYKTNPQNTQPRDKPR